MSATPAPAPFIVGVGRSGTTLLRLMLDAHPELAIPPETHILPDLFAAVERGEDAGGVVDALVATRRWADFDIDPDQLRERIAASGNGAIDATGAARAFYGLYAEQHDKPRWGDKTPRYSLIMREISAALPEARFIHLIRDGRDIALSRAKMVSQKGGKPTPPKRVAKRWRDRIGQAREQAAGLPHYIELRYEDLVTDTEPTLRTICEFIELDFTPEMLDYHEHAGERLAEIARELPAGKGRGPVSGEHRLNVHKLATEPPKTDRIANWKRKMDPADRVAFERAAGPLLRELGYETEGLRGRVRARLARLGGSSR